MNLLRRAPREMYRVYDEEEFLADPGAELARVGSLRAGAILIAGLVALLVGVMSLLGALLPSERRPVKSALARMRGDRRTAPAFVSPSLHPTIASLHPTIASLHPTIASRHSTIVLSDRAHAARRVAERLRGVVRVRVTGAERVLVSGLRPSQTQVQGVAVTQAPGAAIAAAPAATPAAAPATVAGARASAEIQPGEFGFER